MTGSSGQIGRRLIEKLDGSGARIAGMDVIPTKNAVNYEFIQCDFADMKSLEQLKGKLDNIDTMVHLASVINDSRDIINDAIRSIDLNITGTLNILEFLPSINHICYSSSYMVYGKPVRNPIDENHPTHPNNIYGASKLATEKYLEVYSKTHSIHPTLAILRLMGVYGPGTPPGGGRAIPNFIQRALGNESPVIYGKGKSRRNYVYIDDAVDAIILAIARNKSGTWNIGGNDAWSVKDIAETIVELSDVPVKPEYKQSPSPETDFICDIKKAETDLGIMPKWGMRDGLKNEINALRGKSGNEP